MQKLQTPTEKSRPPLSQQTHSKSWGLVKPPFLKIWLEVQPPSPPSRKEGMHTMTPNEPIIFGILKWSVLKFKGSLR